MSDFILTLDSDDEDETVDSTKPSGPPPDDLNPEFHFDPFGFSNGETNWGNDLVKDIGSGQDVSLQTFLGPI
jgi:hypothetical protein